MQLIVTWVVLSLGLWLISALVPGFHLKGFGDALVVGAVFGILNWALGWLLFTIIGVGTLFIGFVFDFITRWVVTAIVLKLTDSVTDRLSIDSFKTALVAAAILSFLGSAGRFLH
jgi:putative membrane protein